MTYDLAVIGAGWAGFNASCRAHELGLRVALIEKGDIGGTCLNAGCIPTKTLLQSAKLYQLIKKSSLFGIETAARQVNFTQIQSRKEKVIQELRQGMEFMLKGVDVFTGEAQIISPDTVKVGARQINSRFIIVATGSRPIELANLKFDAQKIISSGELLNIKEIPQSLLVIGGGVIGCEFAHLFSSLGTEVSLIEKMPQLLPGIDKEIARKLELIFKKKGIKVSTNTDTQGLDTKNYELILVCVGRSPAIDGLGLDKLGVRLERDRVIVDEYLKTSIANIFAAGDCTARFMLAHFAAYQGRISAENIARPDSLKKADNTNIPNCIFTDPSIASVGLNEEEARARQIEVKINKFDFLASGMARILDEREGFIKIVSDKNSAKVLGAVIIGPQATELIAIFTLAISTGMNIRQIEDTVFSHPSLAETIGEAIKPRYAIRPA